MDMHRDDARKHPEIAKKFRKTVDEYALKCYYTEVCRTVRSKSVFFFTDTTTTGE